METDHGDLTGRVIASQFRVERRLGQGGMGAVYLAEQLEMGRKVVLKVMHPSLLGSAAGPVIEERFKREARIVAQLNHPNVVQVHVFGRTDDGQLYLAMEYIEGRSLRELLVERRALPEARALRILDQLCSALIEAHDLGLVHRDLKPENIMLTDRHGNPEYVKVLDFGIAKMRTAPDARLTQTGAIFGTPQYISPEQARGISVDQRTDIYALGIILYEMVTGQLPFVADNVFDYLQKHVNAPVELPSHRFPDLVILPRTEAIIARAMKKAPVNRFQSAAELQREVREALRDRPDAAKPFPTPALPLGQAVSTPILSVHKPVSTAVLAPTGSPPVGGTAVLPSTTGLSQLPVVGQTLAIPEEARAVVAPAMALPRTLTALPKFPVGAGTRGGTPETPAVPETPTPNRTQKPAVSSTSATPQGRRRVPLLVGAVAVVAIGGYVAFRRPAAVERAASPDGSAEEAVHNAPAAVFGAGVAQIEARCRADGGRWEKSDGDSNICRAVQRGGASSTDARTWFADGTAIAETSYGPIETFEQAASRAKQVAAIRWGQPVIDTWAQDCGRQDPSMQADDAHNRKCRWSWRWRAGKRRTHLVVAPRSANGWQVVLDDSRLQEAGAPHEGLFPAAVGPFRFGETVAEDQKACRAAKGRFVPPTTARSSGCEDAAIPDLGLSGARLILHHECTGSSLCRLYVQKEAPDDRDAIEQFLASRQAMMRWLGPPDQGEEPCGGYLPEHLVDSLRDGHCPVLAVWKKEGADITLRVHPTDAMIGGAVTHPITHWTVSAGFTTPKHDETTPNVEQKMKPPAPDESSNYHFTFSAKMDRIGPDLAGYMEVIRVNGASGNAVMLLNRHGGDRVASPVGLFGTTLTNEQVAKLSAVIDGIKWADLPAPQGGDISASMMSIDFSRGTKIIQRSLNSRNGDLLRALEPMMNQVTEVSRALTAHPLRALGVFVSQSGSGFRLTLRNDGSGPVLLADPRHVPSDATHTRATIRVAFSPPGTDFTDLLWESVPLEPLGTAPATVTLAPGKTHDVKTVSWTPKTAGAHYLQAVWQDYVGTQVNPKDVMDAVPDPDRMNDPRPYVIRGAAFSAYTKFVADKPPH